MAQKRKLRLVDDKRLRAEASAIFDVSYASDTLPRGIMRASRPNSSNDWDEEADMERFNANLDKHLEASERALQILATRGSRDDA